MECCINALTTSPTRTRKCELSPLLSAFARTPASPADANYTYFLPVRATNGQPSSNPAAAHRDAGFSPVLNSLDNHITR